MMSDLDSILEDCLERLAQGETLQACLARYPAHAAELSPLLRAAIRIKQEAQVHPSPRFKAQARAQLYAHMEAHPRSRPRWNIFSLATPRLAMGLTTLLVAFLLTGTAAAQSALPGARLYTWKLASERVGRALSTDPVGYDLFLAERRIDELAATSGNVAAQKTAIQEYNHLVTTLEKYQDGDMKARIQKTLKLQQEKLEKMGLVPVDQETPTPTDDVLPTVIPDSTLPKVTDIPSVLVPTKSIATADDILPKSTAVPPTIKIPTKIKVPTVGPTAIRVPTTASVKTSVLPTLKIPTVNLPTVQLLSIQIPTIQIPGLP